MRRISLSRVLWLGISCFFFFSAGQNGAGRTKGKDEAARGITVGAPKVFDNRTLSLMLDRLNSQLAGITVIDQKALAQAIGAIQGSRIQETSRSLTLQGSPTPALQTENDTSTSLTPPATIPTTSSTTKQTSSTPSTTPTIPGLPDLNSVPSALTNLQYSMSSSDLLSEQVDLTYQIINLRMLLDRSLSDRLLYPDLSPRLQAVIGLNVTVDPPRDAENAVAIIEVTLRIPDACVKIGNCTDSTDSPSLVALMPQEHTYNSVALNSKSNAFGGSAVMKLVTVGYTERRRGQTYYLFRDNDTVSIEKQSVPHSGKVTFGWAFRPVLGRKSVAPGSRQMFAVVSLPHSDSFVPDNEKAPGDKSAEFLVDIKAYWRKYDPGSLTSANDKEIRPWSKVGYVLSLGTILTYAPSGLTDIGNFPLSIPLTSSYLTKLSPDIRSVTWRPVGTKQAVIAVQGQNLFQTTQVAIGDKVLNGAQDGLRLISDQSMDITTDISALSADAAVLGRYGPATPLEQKPDNSYKKPNLTSLYATLDPTPLGGYTGITILPQFGGGQCLEAGDMEDSKLGKPVVFVNAAAVSGPYLFPALEDWQKSSDQSNSNCVSVVAMVPEAQMPKISGLVMLKFPFRDGFSASQRVYDPNNIFKLQTLVAGKDYLLQKANGSFVPSHQEGVAEKKRITEKNWRIMIANDAPLTLSKECPSEASNDSNAFCLLTYNDNMARLSIRKTYPCSDMPTPVASPSPLPSKKSVAAKESTPQEGATGKPKSCLPKAVLLQQAFKDKDGNLSWVATYPVTLPSGQDESEKPTLDPKQSQAVNQHDLVWRPFTGTGLSGIGAVTVMDSQLEINPAKDGKSVSVLIPKWVTKDSAAVDLTFFDKQGGQIGTAQIVVKPNPSGGGK